jgi:hypothetical protein
MHERTERAIARLLFVFCCAVPTFFTFAIVFVTWTPWYHNRQLAALEANWSLETGLIVTIEDFDRVSPYRWSLREVRVHEPETELEVAHVRQLDWICEDDRIGISIHHPELQSAQLHSAWQLIHDRFLCRPELTKVPVNIRTNALTVHSKTGSVTMRELDTWIRPRPNSVEATLQGSVAGNSRFPINVAVTRDRSTDEPKTLWTLETGPTPLPCSALAGYLPLMKRLGADAEFSGTLHWESEKNGGWSVDLGGARFNSVDLGTLFEDLPHSMRGKADVTFDTCRIVPQQIVDLSGTIRSSGGWIRTSLLQAMNEELGFAVQPESLNDPDGEVFYELLALHFAVSKGDMQLTGVCNQQEYYERVAPGFALLGRNVGLAISNGETIPSTRLAHAVAPQHSESVPISGQTAGLLNLFVPPNRPKFNVEGQLPSSRIKRVDHWSDSGGGTVKQR